MSVSVDHLAAVNIPVCSSSIPISFLDLAREREGLKKGVVNSNANRVGRILFNIQVACLPYTVSL